MLAWSYCQKQPPEVFVEIGMLRHFAKFTENHLCQRLFFRAWARNFFQKESLTQVFFL